MAMISVYCLQQSHCNAAMILCLARWPPDCAVLDVLALEYAEKHIAAWAGCITALPRGRIEGRRRGIVLKCPTMYGRRVRKMAMFRLFPLSLLVLLLIFIRERR